MVSLSARGDVGLELGHAVRTESARARSHLRWRPRDAILFDGRPAPSFEEQPFLCMPYCDNGGNVICLEPALGEDVASRIEDLLRGWGLGLQDITPPETCCDSLGVYIDRAAGIDRPTWRRLSRVVAACDRLSRRPHATSKQVEKQLGHITYIAMLYRPLLALLNCFYAFVRKKYVQPVRVWSSVAKELWHCRCVLPLARVNLRLPIQTIVLSSDASLSGMSVCSTTWDHSNAAAVAAAAAVVWSERYRFKMSPDSDTSGARGRALADADVITKKRVTDQFDKAGFKEMTRDADVLEIVTDLTEIEMRMIDRRWHQLFQTKGKLAEAIHVLEARSCMGMVRHVSRSMPSRDCRVILLNDNMGVVLAMTRGRSRHFPLLRQCRRVLCFGLATGLIFIWGWIASELNSSDVGSRDPDAPLTSLELQAGSWEPCGFSPLTLPVRPSRGRRVRGVSDLANGAVSTRHEVYEGSTLSSG